MLRLIRSMIAVKSISSMVALDAEGGSAFYLLNDVRGVDDHLARDTAPVEAGASE